MSDIPSFIAPVPHDTTEVPVPWPTSRDPSCPGEATSDNSKKEEDAPSLLSLMRRRRRVGEKDASITLIKKTSTTSLERWH